MDRNREIIGAKCRNLLSEYDAVLQQIAQDEIAKVRVHANGSNEFDHLKASFLNQGIEEGLKRFIAAINQHAKHHEQN